MFTIGWIISVSILLFSFFGIVFTSLFFAKPVDDYKVSFMRMFPFEISKTAESNGKFYRFATYLFSGMCFTPIIVIVEENSRLSELNPLSIFISCLLGLAALCFIFLNVFDVTHVKPHLSIFGVFALLAFLSSALVTMRAFIGFDIFRRHGFDQYLLLVSGILTGIVALSILAVLFNPKLRFWAKLDEVDGNYVRPKRFPLAYSEWALLLALFLTTLLYFVQLLVR